MNEKQPRPEDKVTREQAGQRGTLVDSGSCKCAICSERAERAQRDQAAPAPDARGMEKAPAPDMHVEGVCVTGMGKYVAVSLQERTDGGTLILTGPFVKMSRTDRGDLVIDFARRETYDEFLDFMEAVAS